MEREAAIWSSFQHENVVEFLGLFKAREVLGNTLLEQKGELYLVSPFSRLKTIDEHSANLYVSKHRGDFPLIVSSTVLFYILYGRVAFAYEDGQCHRRSTLSSYR